jgi:alpha-beta hydrolase superfamily lysophospholipase
LLAGACLAAPAAPELIRFKAADGTPLAADFRAPKAGKPAFVLLHGVAAGRGEWAPLAEALAKEGYGSLALDFRGHGLSGGPSYTTFTSNESWAALEGDVRAALRALAKRGVPARRAGLIGASVGANLAAKAAAKETAVPCLALLSPGIEYRGIGIDTELSRFERPVLLAASPVDAYAFESAAYLRVRVPAGRATFVQAEQGHGAQMLAHGLMAPLMDWIKSNCGTKGAAAPNP